MAPRLKLRDITFFERPVQFARPFRFGAITINATTQLFVRVEIEVEGRGSAVGASAELLVPKWFDKRAGVFSGADGRRSATIPGNCARALSGADRVPDGVRSACRVHWCPDRDLREEEHSGACGGLWPGGDRQGDPRCAAARR
ncbi:hypothetical protein ACVIJX_003718 [Bradyrhizobium diazoefficiens]